MRGVQLELEALAQAVRRSAGLAPDDFADAVHIATTFVGSDGIVYDDELEGVAYLRRREDGSHEIVLKPGMPDVRFRLLHEVGHLAIRQNIGERLAIDVEERAANYVAAAIMAPADLVRRAHTHFGPDFGAMRTLGQAFGMSATSAELRVGEVVGGERGVATKSGNLIVPHFGPMQLAFPWRESKAKGRDPLVKAILAKARARGFDVAAGAIDDERVAIRVK